MVANFRAIKNLNGSLKCFILTTPHFSFIELIYLNHSTDMHEKGYRNEAVRERVLLTFDSEAEAIAFVKESGGWVVRISGNHQFLTKEAESWLRGRACSHL